MKYLRKKWSPSKNAALKKAASVLGLHYFLGRINATATVKKFNRFSEHRMLLQKLSFEWVILYQNWSRSEYTCFYLYKVSCVASCLILGPYTDIQRECVKLTSFVISSPKPWFDQMLKRLDVTILTCGQTWFVKKWEL